MTRNERKEQIRLCTEIILNTLDAIGSDVTQHTAERLSESASHANDLVDHLRELRQDYLEELEATCG